MDTLLSKTTDGSMAAMHGLDSWAVRNG